LLCCDIRVAYYALPYACIVDKLAHNGLRLACGDAKFFCSGFICLLPHLPVLVGEAIGKWERAKVFFLVCHVVMWDALEDDCGVLFERSKL
jgi:hypothetical protein